MLRSSSTAFVGVLFVVGCAPVMQVVSPVDSSHPASTQAREAERPRLTASLVADAYVAPVQDPLGTAPTAASAGSGAHAGHGDAGAKAQPSGRADPMNPSLPLEKRAPREVAYTCPMHPEVVSAKPGTCPKCGMKLVPKASEVGNMKHGDMK
jgi:hypothetical protein